MNFNGISIMAWLLKHKGYSSSIILPIKYAKLAITKNYWQESSVSFYYLGKNLKINYLGGLSMLDEIFIQNKYAVELNEKNPIIFDVGANVGFFSIWASQYYGQLTPIIYAYEPVHKVYDILSKNTENNHLNNIHIFNKGLSDKNNSSIIYLSYAAGLSSISTKTNTKEEIQVSKLIDEILAHKIKKINLLKIDTEGSEVPILKSYFNSNSKIFIENIVLEYHSLEDLKIIKEILLSNNYSITHIDSGNIGVLIAKLNEL